MTIYCSNSIGGGGGGKGGCPAKLSKVLLNSVLCPAKLDLEVGKSESVLSSTPDSPTATTGDTTPSTSGTSPPVPSTSQPEPAVMRAYPTRNRRPPDWYHARYT